VVTSAGNVADVSMEPPDTNTEMYMFLCMFRKTAVLGVGYSVPSEQKTYFFLFLHSLK
jgi:hypothetical protein